jgi:hydroxyacylglutathione hydrolase
MLKLQSAVFNAFQENTYLLTNDAGSCWIIDPGMSAPEERDAITGFIRDNGLTPRGIINTHAHIDHILGVNAMIAEYRIPFALHPLEAPVLAAGRSSAAMFGMELETIPQPDQVLAHGQKLDLEGDVLELRLAPGHSPGSVVFYYPAGGWLIGGDVLFAGSIGRTDLPGGDHATLIRSIREQLFTLPDETVVYPGHGPATTTGREKTTNPFLS